MEVKPTVLELLGSSGFKLLSRVGVATDARYSGAWSLGKHEGGQALAQGKLDPEGRGQEMEVVHSVPYF